MTKKVEDKLQSKSLNELQVKITSATDQELVNEGGRTVVTILMQDDGKIMTSFLGDYNKEILKTFKRVNRLYFKKLYKELIKNNSKNEEKENTKKVKTDKNDKVAKVKADKVAKNDKVKTDKPAKAKATKTAKSAK